MSGTALESRKEWTEAELMALPGDGFQHELVNGDLVMSPKNNWQHGDICVRLLVALETFNRIHRLGAVFDSSTGFWMANRNCRAPDVAFVTKQRLRGLRRDRPGFLQGAPDLAVEILTPHQTRRDLDARLRDFFASGTRLVWIIDPEPQSAEICHGLTQRELVSPEGELDGEDLLPGFRLPIADLFREWEW